MNYGMIKAECHDSMLCAIDVDEEALHEWLHDLTDDKLKALWHRVNDACLNRFGSGNYSDGAVT